MQAGGRMRRERVGARREGARMSEPEDGRAGGRPGRREKRRKKSTRGNGRGEREEASEKPGAQLQTAMGIFETTRPPPLAISFLRLALFRPLFVRRPLLRSHRTAPRRTIEYQRQSAREMHACTRGVRLCRFRVMRNLACASRQVASLDRF